MVENLPFAFRKLRMGNDFRTYGFKYFHTLPIPVLLQQHHRHTIAPPARLCQSQLGCNDCESIEFYRFCVKCRCNLVQCHLS